MQLRKAIHLRTRNANPCCVRGCGKPHPTWTHGKTEEEVEQLQFSRRNNPKDKQFTGKKLKLSGNMIVIPFQSPVVFSN